MRAVKYIKATSWEQAAGALRENTLAKPIAGGSDLLGWIKDDLTGAGEPRWDTFVDIRTIVGSDAISYSASSGLTLGALAPLSNLQHNADVAANYPALAKAAGAVASPNIRHVGTVGGNINQRPRCWYLRNDEFDCYKKGGDFCFAVTGKNEFHAILEGELCYIVHPSDVAPALMALRASAVVDTADGERTVSFDEYFIGPREDVLRETILKQGDLLKEIRIPAPAANSGQSFIKSQTRGLTYDFALANVATVLTMNGNTISEASIVLSGVAPKPYRVTGAEQFLAGKTADAATARQAADQGLLGARPMTENAFKVDLSKALIVRSVLEAAANA